METKAKKERGSKRSEYQNERRKEKEDECRNIQYKEVKGLSRIKK